MCMGLVTRPYRCRETKNAKRASSEPPLVIPSMHAIKFTPLGIGSSSFRVQRRFTAMFIKPDGYKNTRESNGNWLYKPSRFVPPFKEHSLSIQTSSLFPSCGGL